MHNAKVIERIDTHDRILWLPALAPDVAVAYRALLEGVLAPTKSWDEAAEILDMRGLLLTLKVEHHGPQTYREWSLAVCAGTWAAARLAELEA